MNIAMRTHIPHRRLYKKTKILDLNDDCLKHVIDMLDDQDVVQFALISPRFYKLCMRFRSDLTNDIKRELQIILVDTNTEDCNELFDLYIHGFWFSDQWNGSEEYEDGKFKQGQRLPNIKVVILSGNPVTGKYIAGHSNLRELYLDDTHLTAKNLYDIAQNCTQLCLLDIRDVRMSFGSSIVLGANCHQLETLRFTCGTEDVSALARLPKLRDLWVRNISQTFLVALVEHKATELVNLVLVTKSRKLENENETSARFYVISCGINVYTLVEQDVEQKVEAIAKLANLKTLSWIGSFKLSDRHLGMLYTLRNLEKLFIKLMPLITNEGLMAVLRGCPSLKRIELCYCEKITGGFVFDAINFLEGRGATSKPFKLVACTTSIRKQVLRHPRYINASSIFVVKHVELHKHSLEDRDRISSYRSKSYPYFCTTLRGVDRAHLRL